MTLNLLFRVGMGLSPFTASVINSKSDFNLAAGCHDRCILLSAVIGIVFLSKVP